MGIFIKYYCEKGQGLAKPCCSTDSVSLLDCKSDLNSMINTGFDGLELHHKYVGFAICRSVCNTPDSKIIYLHLNKGYKL